VSSRILPDELTDALMSLMALIGCSHKKQSAHATISQVNVVDVEPGQ